MMEISVRKTTGGFKEIKIQDNNTIIDLGLFNKSECASLACHLKTVIESLEEES